MWKRINRINSRFYTTKVVQSKPNYPIIIASVVLASTSFYFYNLNSNLSILNQLNFKKYQYYEYKNDLNNQNLQLSKILKEISKEEGNDHSELNDSQFKLLNLKQLNKNPEFRSEYINLVIKLILIKYKLNDFKTCLKLNNYIINLPYDYGLIENRIKSLRIQSKLDFSNSENYLIDSIKLNKLNNNNIQFNSLDSYTLTDDSSLNNELINSMIALSYNYILQEKYLNSFELLLNLRKLFEINNYEISDLNNSLINNYLGYLFKSQQKYSKSIEFFNNSISNNEIINKNSLKNLIELYKLTNDNRLDDTVLKYKENDSDESNFRYITSI